MPHGGTLYLSGGSMHRGVGISISKKFGEQLADVSFQPFSPRLCTLDFKFRSQLFRAFSVYFPTTWDSDEPVDELYDLIDFLLEDCRTSERIPFIGGDFNASIGMRRPDDDTDALGACGVGVRNARGQLLIELVLRNGLHILSRQGDVDKNADICRQLDLQKSNGQRPGANRLPSCRLSFAMPENMVRQLCGSWPGSQELALHYCMRRQSW